MRIIPGSLNIELPARLNWENSEFAPFKKIYSLTPYGGNRDICLILCEIYKEQSPGIYGFAWGTTHAADEPEYKVLEIISAVRLRETLQLPDGAMVRINIPLPWKS